MRIKDSTLNCSIYLYQTLADARRGVHAGGSGFVVSYPDSRNSNRPFLYFVTNRHVAVQAPVVRLNRDAGGTTAIPVDRWYLHPDGDDIAVAIFNDDGLHTVSHLSPQMFVTREVLERYAIGPGDEVFMIGRFVNHGGQQRNLPIVREGTLAMMPHEPVKDGRDMLVEAYLVEIRSIAGHSGSPVFWKLEPMRHDPTGRRKDPITRVQWLLGIDCGHMQMRSEILDEQGQKLSPRQFVHLNSGIAIVSPAWKLLEVLESAELARHRLDSNGDL